MSLGAFLSEKLFSLDKGTLDERPKDIPKINGMKRFSQQSIRKVKRANRKLDNQHSHRNINSHQLNINL